MRRLMGVVVIGVVLGVPSGASAAPRASDFAQAVPSVAGARVASSGAVVTPAARAPKAFDLLGVNWSSPAKVDVSVRARSVRTGRWSRWVDISGEAEDAPDDQLAPARATGPVWTGRSDRYQLRLSRPARGVRVHFVRVHPGRVRAPRARAAANQPAIIPRAQWAGDQCQPRGTPDYGTVSMAFVHHTDGANNYAPQDSAGIVLAVCRFHRNDRGWSDIGYNFLVDKYGQVFEGRAGGIDRAVVGAQAQGYNAQSTGISMLGTYGVAGVPEEGLRALSQLIAWKLSLHGVPTTGQVTLTSQGGSDNRYPAGTPVTLQRISGHRDGDATDCPGNALYAQLPDIRARASGQAGTGAGPAPPTATRAQLTLAAGAARLAFPAPVSVSGRLALSDGTPIGDARVEIQVRSLAKHYVSVATAQTDAGGNWTASVNSSRTVSVRAYWPGDGTRRAVASPKATVVVAPTLSIAASDRRVRAGQRVKLSGTIAPRKGGVTLLVRKKGRGGWKAVPPGSARARGGKWTVKLRPSAGLYKAKALFAGDARNPKASSSTVFVRVLAAHRAARRTR